jgi:3-oxoacyl-[acyl-carrier protein] reductase
MKKNKIIFVSGSSRGIGKGIAKHLLKNDYSVIINGRNEVTLNDSFKELSKISNDKIFSIRGDITKSNDISMIKTFIDKEFGSINHLVCNVGSGKSKTGLDESITEFRNMFEINFFNAVMLTKELLPSIINNKSKNKSITFISSIAGIEYLDCPISYSCAKSSLNVFSKSLSKTLGPNSIRVNTISPGNIFFEGSTWDKEINKDERLTKEYIKNNVPLNKFGSTDDIAQLVQYIISEKSSFLTGSNLVIDGGQNNSY